MVEPGGADAIAADSIDDADNFIADALPGFSWCLGDTIAEGKSFDILHQKPTNLQERVWLVQRVCLHRDAPEDAWDVHPLDILHRRIRPALLVVALVQDVPEVCLLRTRPAPPVVVLIEDIIGALAIDLVHEMAHPTTIDERAVLLLAPRLCILVFPHRGRETSIVQFQDEPALNVSSLSSTTMREQTVNGLMTPMMLAVTCLPPSPLKATVRPTLYRQLHNWSVILLVGRAERVPGCKVNQLTGCLRLRPSVTEFCEDTWVYLNLLPQRSRV